MSNQYQNAYKRASVNTMDRSKLVVMLYDGAIRNIKIGIESMRSQNLEKTHQSLTKAKSIISELSVSLDMEKGGEVATNLRSLYLYMFDQLIEANIRKDAAIAANVLKLLLQLREAWAQIATQNQTPSEDAPAAAPGAKRVNIQG